MPSGHLGTLLAHVLLTNTSRSLSFMQLEDLALGLIEVAPFHVRYRLVIIATTKFLELWVRDSMIISDKHIFLKIIGSIKMR